MDGLWSRRTVAVQIQEEPRTDSMPDAAAGLRYNVASMPGIRFQATEEELVDFYLRRTVMGDRMAVELINIVDLYRYDPWELPELALMQGEHEWLFFCPRADLKHPRCEDPSRITMSGYWKITRTDRVVRDAQNKRNICLMKTLTFYSGQAPSGRETEWIMDEYRLPLDEHILLREASCGRKDLREVCLCRLFKKPDARNPAESSTCNVEISEQAPAAVPQTPLIPPPRSPASRLAPRRRKIAHQDAPRRRRRVKRDVREPTLQELQDNMAPDNYEETMAGIRRIRRRQRRSKTAGPADAGGPSTEVQVTTDSESDDVNASAGRVSDGCHAHIEVALPDAGCEGRRSGQRRARPAGCAAPVSHMERLLRNSPTVLRFLIGDGDDVVDAHGDEVVDAGPMFSLPLSPVEEQRWIDKFRRSSDQLLACMSQYRPSVFAEP